MNRPYPTSQILGKGGLFVPFFYSAPFFIDVFRICTSVSLFLTMYYSSRIRGQIVTQILSTRHVCGIICFPLSPHTTHKNMAPPPNRHRATSNTASAAARGSMLPVPAQCTCSPHHGQRLARSVCFILRRGVISVPFLSVHFKAKFCQSGGTSATASAPACGSMSPIPAQCTCSPHHG